MSYWQDRMAQSQTKLTEKTTKQVEEQLTKYYTATAKQVIKDFENTYDKLQAAIKDGKEPTPADLYKLDKYWQAQAQARAALEKLGEKQVAVLTKAFERNFAEVYHSIALDSGRAFGTLDSEAVSQMVNQIWCADGKSWSQRVWGNTQELLEELNEGLIHCVAAGKKTTDLKKILQDRFGVGYSRADTLVRTELAHIQTQAAKKRYEDYGVQEVEIWADEDERRCKVCGELHQKRYPVGANIPIPAHPNCRCTIVPVVENSSAIIKKEKEDKKNYQQINNKQLTEDNKNDTINFDVQQQKAVDKINELKNIGNRLKMANPNTERHKAHIEETTGLTGDKGLAKYEEMATKFLQTDIDNDIVEGFVNKQNYLFKYNKNTNEFAILDSNGKIATYFKPVDKLKYWEKQVKKFKGV